MEACFNILQDLDNGDFLLLELEYSGTAVSDIYTDTVVMSPTNRSDEHQYFVYSSMAISTALSQLCLTFESSPGFTYEGYFRLTTCDGNVNQLFIIIPSGQIYNPTWPANTYCLNGNGELSNGLRSLQMTRCEPLNSDETFTFGVICKPGDRPLIIKASVTLFQDIILQVR